MLDSIELKNKCKEIENKYKLNHYEVLQRYIFERILERISVSKYKDNFILKGGLLLTAMFGINIEKESMLEVLNEILSINLNDGVKFEIIDITDIREDDEYGGNKYHIVGKFQNTKINLEIDISTGDTVTPRELKYKYPLLFEDRYIIIDSYNIETIIAEKLETILRRGSFNSRMKDYYDLYYFLSYFKDEIDEYNIIDAINNTFIKRNSFEYLKDYKEIIKTIQNSTKMQDLWNRYSNKYSYSKDINFNDILVVINSFLDETC